MGVIGAQALQKNPNWKGGRTLASNGYWLVKRPSHPNADIRGYIYEHRLVAEEKIGRPLVAGEVVHHIDHNKQNNHPDNLQISESIWHHRREHSKNKTRRSPGEDNPVIGCACGCGKMIRKYDNSGRPRKYITGHNQENGKWVQAK